MQTMRGKDKIQSLLIKAIEKYKTDTGEDIKANQNPENYSGLSRRLSEISNRLPVDYPNDFESDPGGKFNITNAQVRDAYMGKVESLKRHFYEALHLYIYSARIPAPTMNRPLLSDSNEESTRKDNNSRKKYLTWLVVVSIMFLASLFLWLSAKHQLKSIVHDMRITPYQPTQAEIDSLEGVWIVITGSPQARPSDTDRYHKIVINVLEVKYKDGYFTFNRFGPVLNQKGFMQFEFRNLISMHTYLYTTDSNNEDSLSAVKHTLMRLERGKDKVNVISASWNYDFGGKSMIIGIREVYIRMGNGSINEITDPLIKNNLQGRLYTWHRPGNKADTSLHVQNVFLDTIPDGSLQKLIDQGSIILKDPDSTTLKNSPPPNWPGRMTNSSQ